MYISYTDSVKYHIMPENKEYTLCGRQAQRKAWITFSAEPPAEHEPCQYCARLAASDELAEDSQRGWGRAAL
jgi:hypothetical protein